MVKSNSSRKVLVILEQRDAGEAGSMPIRRYRLARLRLDERAAGEEPRFEHSQARLGLATAPSWPR